MGENREYVTRPSDRGSINISEEVISIIASTAASEVEGVAGLTTTVGKDLAERFGRKILSKGVKITVEEDQIIADVCIIVKLGYPVNEVASKVQASVSTAIESMTGFKVLTANVNICGVALNK